MNLVTDEQPRVAAAAVRALGELHPPVAFGLLLELASSGEAGSFGSPSALGGYHGTEHVDAVLERIADRAAARTRVSGLTQALWATTFKLFPVNRGLFGPSSTPSRRVVVEHITWWQRHRSMSVAERAQPYLANELAAALDGSDPEATRACQSLALHFDVDCSLPDWRRQHEDELRLVRALLQQGDVWQALAPPFGKRSQGLELLAAVDPARTRRLALEPMWQRGGRGTFDPTHGALVPLAGIDLGDPALAACEHRAEVMATWREWALAEGWLP